MKDFIFVQDKFIVVQLCERSWKHRHVTILSNHVTEMTKNIFFTDFVQIFFLKLILFRFIVCSFLTYLCFPYGL